MKRRLIVICTIFLAGLPIFAQSRLRTMSAVAAVNSSEFRILLDSIACSSSFTTSCYIDHWHREGFYVDERAGTLCHTSYKTIASNWTFQVTDCIRRIFQIDSKNAEALSILLNLAVSTSSPQDYFDISNGSVHSFLHGADVAVCVSPDEHSLSGKLVDICGEVCEACKADNMAHLDDLYLRIADLTVKFKQLLHYDFSTYDGWDNTAMRIGSVGGYLYVLADFDKKIDHDKDSQYKEVLEHVAHFLISNSDASSVVCYIKVQDSVEKGRKQESLYDIVVCYEDFTAEKMEEICRDILCRDE